MLIISAKENHFLIPSLGNGENDEKTYRFIKVLLSL